MESLSLVSNTLHKLGGAVSGGTAIIQGFGNVGSNAARTLASYGMNIIGISDVTGAIWNEHGIDITKLQKHVAKRRCNGCWHKGEAVRDHQSSRDRSIELAHLRSERIVDGLKFRVGLELVGGHLGT